MAAYLQLGEISGEAVEEAYERWILIQHANPVIKTCDASGSQLNEQDLQQTQLSIVIKRDVDLSTPQLMEACAQQRHFSDAAIAFCAGWKGRCTPYLVYRLKGCMVVEYSASVEASGDPVPSEKFELTYEAGEWQFFQWDVEGDGSDRTSVGRSIDASAIG